MQEILETIRDGSIASCSMNGDSLLEELLNESSSKLPCGSCDEERLETIDDGEAFVWWHGK